MLSEKELKDYFEKHNISEPVREYIRLTRAEPSRLAGTQATTNVITGFISSKTMLTVQTESRTGEYACALELEYSTKVWEFWDQPQPVSVARTYSNGKKRPGSYTPDFLVLNHDGPEILEIKPEKRIQILLQKHPADWQKTESGVIYLPALEAFEKLGLRYRVVPDAEFSPIRTANLKLLLQSRGTSNAVNDDIQAAVKRAMAQDAWIRLSVLGERLGITDLTTFIQMIDRGILHASLTEELLAQPESAWVSSSATLLALRKKLGPSNPLYEALPDTSGSVPCELVPKTVQASRALKILDLLKSGGKKRSVSRWKKKIREAAARGVNEFLAVLPQTHRSGNKKQRLHQTCVDFLQDFIKKPYSSPKRLGKKKGHALYKQLAEEAHPHLRAISRTTFNKYLRLANQRKIASGRGGRRAANAASEPSPVGDRQLLATRPFELGTMDHYKADIVCILAARNGTLYRARPWISVLIDVNSGDVLAVWVSFRAPSMRACAMVIRLCVRNHGRLPEEIIVDRGPDFQSVYFFALLAHCQVGLVQRPAEHPRYGSEAERFFLAFKTQWLSMRPGNLANYDEARAVSGSHSPYNLAELTIEQLLSELLAFCQWYNANKIGLGIRSPVEQLAWGVRTFSCSGRPVTHDQNFILASAVDVRDYTLDPTRGIHIGALRYWDPALTKLAADGRVKEVRMEPEDPYRIYALVGQTWITCLALAARRFNAQDPVLRLAEAIRVHDGQATRQQAKDDADQDLIKMMREVDAKRSSETANTNGVRPAAPSQDKSESTSSFKDLRNIPVAPLKTSDWRK